MARYTHSPGYIDAVAVQERDLNSDDDFGDDDEVVYYHGNTLSTAYCLTDDGENVVERYRYDAYGGCTVLDADGSDDADGVSDVGNPYAFTGRRLDVESGLMQYRNRYYSPDSGRFVSRDPLGYFLPDKANSKRPDALRGEINAASARGSVNDFNLYRYVHDNPLIYSDPMGLGCWCDCMLAMHKRYWGQTAICLTAVGALGALAAEACVVGCLFAQAAYPVCVAACFASVGIGGAAAGVGCAVYYEVKMTASLVACSVVCLF